MTADIIEISRLALHDQVASRLRTMLVEGHIAPGAKLNERELCLQLRVSRTPLREAIKLLAAEGLVDLLPNRGAVAVKLTEADVLNTFEVLAMLEGMSGELAAKRITDEELAEVRALHYEMMACFARRDLSGYYRLNARIHTAINEAAGNPVLASTYRSINARVQSLRFRTNQNDAKWKHAVEEHEQMVNALATRDAPAMRKVMVAHLMRKRDTVLELMRAGEIYPQTHKAS
ncbi:GntR family transcriptional regulator [Variovorax sp. CCNWLW225]|jgi:DNA-binding GntR family transcriptional regulator|uniref:FCD domain-containing protein n=1 Tax=Variovorax paradoxus TaxID=34073 RepID=A0A6I6H9P1_VARPD|nr:MULTISPECIES: GntR family transcriptional regulator [Variovorax]MCR8960518.1 GntR family transcriptional regulator [Variovorax sp. S12S4]QGW82469.1 FCD domain-containing protein [Variovorax paradoxus]WGT65721.1 GntR family transcriptional regulator [Variovorax paradoxus]